MRLKIGLSHVVHRQKRGGQKRADICAQTITRRQPRATVKKGKVFPYSLPSVGPGADPGVQAVSPQVT